VYTDPREPRRVPGSNDRHAATFVARGGDPFYPRGEKAVALLFVRTDCPISNRCAPEIQRLYQVYLPQGVNFHLVYPEYGLTAAAMDRHREEYGYTVPALLDIDHQYLGAV
jgi:hypothetical protein